MAYHKAFLGKNFLRGKVLSSSGYVANWLDDQALDGSGFKSLCESTESSKEYFIRIPSGGVEGPWVMLRMLSFGS